MRDRDGHGSVPVAYTGALPDPFRDGREVIVDVRKQGDVFVGAEGLAGDEVPVEVHGRQDARPDVLVAGQACLILALGVALYGIGASLYGARARRPRVGRLRPPRGLRAGRRDCVVAFVILEAAFLRSDFSFALVADALLDHDAGLLPRDRDVVLAGGLAAAVAAAARRCGRA